MENVLEAQKATLGPSHLRDLDSMPVAVSNSARVSENENRGRREGGAVVYLRIDFAALGKGARTT